MVSEMMLKWEMLGKCGDARVQPNPKVPNTLHRLLDTMLLSAPIGERGLPQANCYPFSYPDPTVTLFVVQYHQYQ